MNRGTNGPLIGERMVPYYGVNRGTNGAIVYGVSYR